MQASTAIQELFPTFVLGLDESEVDVLADLAQPRRLSAGEAVFRHGDPAGDLVVVVDGALRVQVPPDLALGVKGRGEWAGDLAFIQPGPAPATVKATDGCELLTLPQSALAELAAHPRIVGRLWSALARNLASRTRTCVEQCSLPARTTSRKALRHALATLHGMPPVHEPATWVPSMRPAPVQGEVDVATAREQLVHRLAAVEVFGPLDRKFLTLLARAAVFSAYEPGETIVREGDQRDRLYLILDGRVRVTMPQLLADRGTGTELHAGEMIGQLSFVDGGPRSATCTAIEPTLVAAWYPAMIEEFLRLGADGGVAAVHFLHWVTRQIARDAGRVCAFLRAAHAWSP